MYFKFDFTCTVQVSYSSWTYDKKIRNTKVKLNHKMDVILLYVS